ncbi:RBBP9/YdeN family alpha/beta hydrolase [Chitinimonas koreensis]|uniref:RBBP9/YdeN family alpha/beta hydrolase n=1 Tax=Chitinimonas koreensis TaxID=356302 RepID=UPI000414698A|nr:alpha/beta hydrolase [Chitinimonas koreensis]QNM98566.1 alpha/beta hydrolase [Chitinimonas koreensis]
MNIVIHPGWQDSGPDHWQSIWQAALPRSSRVAQADWDRPQLDDWVAALDRHLAALDGPAVLVCHSLGCITLAHWSARTANRHGRVAAALLVAPADVGRGDAPAEIVGFAPIPFDPLPFPATVVASDDDPFCEPARSRAFAAAWGARLVTLAGAGHINAAAGFGAWPEGRALLDALCRRAA